MIYSATVGKYALSLSVAAMFLSCIPPALAKSPDSQEGKGQSLVSKYWDGVECAACHEGAVKQFARTRHGRAMEFGGLDEVSCRSCHGDTTQHLESANPTTIKNPANLKHVEIIETCMTCHASGGHQQLWSGSTHDSSDVSCLECHSVHNPKSPEKLLVEKDDRQLCLSCHTEVRKAQYQRSTHLIRNEWGNSRMGCVSCHQPHGSTGPSLLQEASLNETCYKCHTEKRGPFLWEHAPARENCANCHTPHGSNNPGLLTRRSTFLCQSCHIQGRHQTVAGRENSTWLINRQCLNCHPMIHGSNHPSGILYHR